MKIGIIGAGNVGTHLAKLFASADTDVFICTKNTNVLYLAGFPEDRFVDSPSRFPKNIDLVFFTRRDRDLDSVLDSLNEKCTVVHCSGTMDMNRLKKFDHYGVFYPLQTFRKELNLENKDFPIFIEASDEDTEEALTQVARKITPHVFYANLALRRHIHLAGVLSSNFVNFLYAIAYEQIPEGFDANEILFPLMKETLSRLKYGHPDEFQTGPAVRKDEDTMQKQMQMLEKHPELQELYRSLSEIIKNRHS